MNDETSRSGRWRAPLARTLTVLGVLLGVISIAANFVERQALDRDELEETAGQLVSDQAIQEEVAASLADALFANVDVRAALEQRFPPDQQALAGPIAGGLRPVAERLALRILQRPRFQQAWVRALGAAQEQVVRVLDDDAVFLETEGGVVTLDLRPLLVELTDQLPIVPNLSERLPEDAGVITVFEAEQLENAQTVTALLRLVADWIWVLALAVWAVAVYLARDRRKEVRAIALGFVVVGVLVLLVRRVAGRYIVDELSTSGSDEEAVRRSWEILTRLLADAGWATIAIGVVALIGVWLVGPSPRGSAARAWLAPHLRNPAYAFGAAALIFVLLVLWSPISYTERPLTLLALAVLGALGVETLRRTAARDVPDAEGRRPSLASILPGARGTAGPADELERLARLRTEGVLTEDEFTAAKARALAIDTPARES